MIPLEDEIWFCIKHDNMTLEQFRNWLLSREELLKEQFILKNNEEDTSA